VPLIFATGAGASSRHSVGMTVFGGMSAVAILGTMLVPSFYVLVENLKSDLKEKIKRIK
jgi:multidrug efflux pump subunit AcrB